MIATVFALFLLGATEAPLAGGSPPAPRSPGFWILACDMTEAGAAAEHAGRPRTFRMGTKSFQQLKPGKSSFGPNLCLSFPCVASGDRMEGTISSASLILTIRLNPQTRAATWRTVGASGLTSSSGACSVQADKPTGQSQ